MELASREQTSNPLASTAASVHTLTPPPAPVPPPPSISLLSLPLPAFVLTLSRPAPTLSQTQVHSRLKRTRCQLNSPAVRLLPLAVCQSGSIFGWHEVFSRLDVVFLKLSGSNCCSSTPRTEENIGVSLKVVMETAKNLSNMAGWKFLTFVKWCLTLQCTSDACRNIFSI